MKTFLAGLVLLLVSCGAPETLRVRQFHLRDTQPASGDLFIRAEMNKRLHGAVTKEERALRMGDYYHVRWHGLGGRKPVKILFEYRQARTGARILRYEAIAPASSEGDRQIRIWGEDFRDNGRVSAWRVSLYEGSEVVAQKQSFLWD